VAEGTGGEIVAEFQEVMRQWNRMCNIIDKTKYFCSDGVNGYICPMRNNGLCNKSVSCQTDSDWKDGEKMIMSWAAEHPEPVYPSWIDWLMANGVIPDSNSAKHSMESGVRAATFYVTSKAFTPIPADIAQKLGIEPKEDAC
jgi:hypothetical protein